MRNRNPNYTLDANNDFDSQDSSEEQDSILGFSAEFDTFPIILAFFIMPANLFVLIFIGKVRSLRTATNLILGSLASSDLLNGSLGISLYLVCSATQGTAVCGSTQILTNFFSISTVLHLLLVSIDRHVAIVHALRYQSLLTTRKVLYMLLFTWTMATLAALTQLSWMVPEIDVKMESELNIARISAIYGIVCIVVFFAIPLVTMMVCYVTIFKALRKQLRNIARNNVPSFNLNKERRRSWIRERRAAFTFITMICIYIVCWFPYFILNIQHEASLFDLPILVEYIFFYYPKFINSLLNPLLYVYGKHDFRQALRYNRYKRQQASSLTLENLPARR